MMQYDKDVASYKQAIDILASGEYDATKITLQLAKTFPHIFVALATVGKSVAPPPQEEDRTANERPTQWMWEVVNLLLEGEHVAATRILRAAKGFNLRRASALIGDLAIYAKSNTHVDHRMDLIDPRDTADTSDAVLYDQLCRGIAWCKRGAGVAPTT